MTEEDKKLLLKDLSARLPYGVKIALKNDGTYHHDNVAKKGDVTIDRLKGFTGSYFTIYHDNPLDWDWTCSEIDIEDIKPYLLPLSSMTEEQEEEYNNLNCYELGCFPHLEEALDYLIENHFDYRGLIDKGLALDATNKNIY